MDVPFYEQDNDYSCGSATLQMIFEYFGKKESQQNIAAVLNPTPSRGVSHRGMLRVARRYGFVCRENIRSTIKDVRYYLDRKIPIIVNYIEPDEDVAHYAVVFGVTDREIIMHDPTNGKGFRMNIEEFEKRWYNSTRQSKRWFMALSPQRFSFPANNSPRKLAASLVS